jgi:hypothetical protein
MAPFLFPGTRRAKVEWFMDRYASAIALYPHARRHYFVGHSNGTYLLARALREYRCCRFERVVFAGSVVPSRYDWESLVLAARPRVRGVLNLIATADWVVAVFPSLFERWGSKDLGGAGHDGFRQARALPAVAETRFVRGGHGAAIHEPWWRAIAAFLLHGEVPNAVALDRSAIVALLGFLSPLVWAILAALVCFGAVWVSGIGPAPIGGALVVVYGLLFWKILTRL